jgi:hypothetical protein
MSAQTDDPRTVQAASAAVLRMIQGLHVSRAVYIAAKLGIADLLAGGCATSDDLARRTQTHPRSLYRILRLLAALGVLTEPEPRRFGLTPLGERLRAGVPNSMREWATQLDGLGGLRAFDEILTAVRSGTPSLSQILGCDWLTYLSQHPETARIFQASMSERTAALAPTVASGYDFGALRSVVDVGGGTGTMLVAILTAHPRLHGVLYEVPVVTANAETAVRDSIAAARCEIVAGDFFAAVPTGGDAYILANVLHDWDDDDCVRILQCCRRAMAPGSKVLVIERMIVDDPVESLPTLLSDLHMMVLTGGMERTYDEYGRLFAEARLELTRVIPVQPPYGIFEASVR